jgi:tetratricopeptide (TPR) repeat protein
METALAYYNMALIQSNAGDDYGAQESLTLSLKKLDENLKEDRSYLASDYNQLGMTYYNLGENKQAIQYYQLALHFADDPKLRPYILNNEGNSYQYLKAYKKSIACYHAVINSVGKAGIIYARALTNLANTKWLQDHHYNAAPELLESLAIRLRENDQWGQNSSYAHLADFYTAVKPDSALWYSQKMLTVARALPSPDDQQQALQKLILLSSPEKSKVYFRQYQVLSDSLQSARNAAKNQFAVIRYNVEKQKAENLQLQKQNTEKRYQLIAVLSLVVLTGLGLTWWLKKRKQRLRLKTEQEIRESKFQLSQKVHDKVANGIYRIMSEVEHLPEIDRTVLLDQLENMYNVSRNVAHDEPQSAIDFTERVSTMLYAFKSQSLRLAVTGNEKELWQAVSTPTKEELLLALQELMVNMSKHSQAKRAYVGFFARDGQLSIDYRDDGVGLNGKEITGRGMLNTVSRIKALNGTISFDSGKAEGLQVLIQIPISH